jgi:SAM-dependent methyltransferase
MNQNFWNHPITTPLDALKHDFLPEPLRHGARRIFKEFLLPEVEIEELIHQVWDVSRDPSPEALDRRLQKLLIGKLDEGKTRRLLDLRAHHVAKQLRPFLIGDSLLDVGTGDGMVASNIQSHFKRHFLVDVINYLDPRVRLPFQQYAEGAAIPCADNSFDTTILTNVLHHSLDPMRLLRESIRVTRRRLIIIESVYADEDRLGQSEIPFSLPAGQQFIYTSFFDWFYNRVLHSDVPVPFNFLPPQRWTRIFSDLGLIAQRQLDLGIDVEIVPIHHFLYALDKPEVF